MLDPDVPVWHRFLDRHGKDFERFYYNVRITAEDLAARFKDPAQLELAEALLPKRIDAVGEKDGEVYLIEVSEVTGLRSLGQLLTYRTLWTREHPDDPRPIRAVLVCAQCPLDERLAAEAAGITVIAVAD